MIATDGQVNAGNIADRYSAVAMTPAHLDSVMVHEKAMFGAEAWSRQAYLEEISDPDTRAYFAVLAADELLGWAGVRVVSGAGYAEAEVLTVGVVPAARRSGIGRYLLHILLDEAHRRGATEVFLEVRTDNDAARQLYRGEGFAELGVRRGYYDGGRVDALTMHKHLEPARPESAETRRDD